MSSVVVTLLALLVLGLRVFTLYHLSVRKSGRQLTSVLLRWSG